MSRTTRPRIAMVVAGWLTVAVVAAAVTLAAISSIGSGIFGESTHTRSQVEVARALGSYSPSGSLSPAPAVTASTGPSASVSPPAPASARRLIASVGGKVLAHCTGRDVVVLSWTPAQGYRMSDVDQEDPREVEVVFEGEDDEVRVTIRCQQGTPVAETEQDD